MEGAPKFDQADRDQAFGYECHRCLRCCRHKRIQLNPYEVARLAQARGMSTTALRTLYTLDGQGVELAQAETGDCVFLGPEGCTVHPDRPLVCRLYPLGRFVSFDGAERFGAATPHPQTAGVYHTRGSIADFLDSQEVDAFIAAADDYMAWLTTAMEQLREATGLEPEALLDERGEAAALMDLDAVVAAYCTETGTPEPVDLEARRRLHLSILYAILEKEGEETDGT
jgi:Fe-S-cluster containining protein